jgi:hypothetical protein
MKNESLPRSLVWEGEHVSDLGLTCLADGQEGVLGEDAVEHVESCEWCAGRLGRMALVSSAVGEAVRAVEPAAAEQTDARRSPRPSAAAPSWALALGVGVALVATIPSTHGVLRSAVFTAGVATHTLQVLVRSGLALTRTDAFARGLPVATVAASALLVLMGWTVARWIAPAKTMGSEGSRS